MMPSDDVMRQSIHTVPTFGREHTAAGFDCWCRPAVLMLCEECEAAHPAQASCWRCGGDGTVPCDPATYDGAHGLLIVHNAEAATTTYVRSSE